MRSLLFVPGDDEKKLGKAAASGADVVLIDLEDAVAPGRKDAARATVASYLKDRAGKAGPMLYVRVNALDSGLIEADLDAVMPAAPAGIMLPKACGGRDVAHLGTKIAVREAECDLPDGGTRIIAIGLETGRSFFQMASFEGTSHRLAGLTWGAEDLAADIGASANRDAEGGFTSPFRLAREITLFAAAAAEIAAIDTVYVDFRNEAGLRAECEAARRDGFSGKLAIHPAQVAVINDVFTPSPAEIARARAIIEAFAANPEAGVLNINGKMTDQPHLKQARRLMARAVAAGVA